AKEEGITAILTLHDPNLASIYSDRIALVKKGRIIAIGNPNEILREELLEEVYDIPVHVLTSNGFRVIMPKEDI
ncbi:MAG: ABC transporter ATP-binding protein, partial [Nitrospiraceae bacterium]|nr:ABC transporter ATP-binding protein [Nitrospiraceae bacterium]